MRRVWSHYRNLGSKLPIGVRARSWIRTRTLGLAAQICLGSQLPALVFTSSGCTHRRAESPRSAIKLSGLVAHWADLPTLRVIFQIGLRSGINVGAVHVLDTLSPRQESNLRNLFGRQVLCH